MVPTRLAIQIYIRTEDIYVEMVKNINLPFTPNKDMTFHVGEADDEQPITTISYNDETAILEVELEPLEYDSVGDLQHYVALLYSRGWKPDFDLMDERVLGLVDQVLNPFSQN